MKKISTLAIGIALVTFIVHAQQSPSIEWQNTIGGSSEDQLRSIQQTVDGGYILGGWSLSNITGDKMENSMGGYDYWIVKTDSLGSIQWQNTIGGDSDDELYNIQQTADGGYILGGWSSSNISGDKTENSNGGEDYWIVKTDSLGNIQWQNTIGGDSDDELHDIQQTTDGGYILGGWSDSNISGDKTENNMGMYSDYWIVKTDTMGNIQWQNTIGGSEGENLYSIQQTTDGGYILGGWSTSNISGDKTENNWDSTLVTTDCWILKTDSLGNIQWQNTIGGNNEDEVSSIKQTADGGYILGGYSWSDISGDKTENCMGVYDYWIVKTDTMGNIQWQNTIGGSCYDVLYSIQQTTDGGYILGGRSCSNISGDKTENSNEDDYWIVKTDFAGNIQWQNTIGGNYVDHLRSIQQTTDGGYIVGGHSQSDISGDKTENCIGGWDYWIIKLAPDIGCQANFYLTPDTLIPHHYWAINQASGSGSLDYLWSWGDGTYDSIAYPSHIYADSGFYTICLTIHDSTGCTDSICIDYNIQKISRENTIVNVDVVDSIPSVPTIIQNTQVLQSWSVFPNPASGKSFINFSLSTRTAVRVELYDVLGNKLKQLINADEDAGEHNASFDAGKLANGVYLLQIHAGNQMQSQMVVVMN